ncbi:MAG: sulfatase [Lentisphaerae bacterium]|nr:sulfatase [Lentisphaerota bacterium]MBT4822991.1 sulfatase [Lentisphaerota bacterium]MBT5612334.1 sulfatase [Lentisphaerota bacterium]MBT7056638.1 sulfatase [Lentisphaerota bacterium]MBT7840563.1 sulfatase [Lentisphaerota bacterium]
MVASVAFVWGIESSSAPAKRPNILFIMSDDHACNAIGAYGSKLISTPRIDRLADEGAILRENFCANSICSPSRASILTGLHSHLNGVTHNGARWDGSQTTYSRLLADAGYQTALIGKWHQKPHTPDREVDHWDVLIGHGGQGSYHDPHFATRAGEVEEKGYCTDLIADKALRWLTEARDPNRPFLLMAQFKAPHVPRRPPARHFKRPPIAQLTVPETFSDDYRGRAPYAAKAWMKVWNGRPATAKSFPNPASVADRAAWADLGAEERAWKAYEDQRNADFHRRLAAGEFADHKAYALYLYRRRLQDYLGCVAAVDENVGRLVDGLEKAGLAADTAVVYCSDQSYFIGEHGWVEKRWMYEEAMRMPFVIRWPGRIKPKTRIAALTQNIDFAPTFLDMAGINAPASMQGRSLLPLLTGERVTGWRDCLYYHYYHHGAHNVPRHDGVRTQRYKLIHFYTDDVHELFDLQKDPHELASVYGVKEHAQVQSDMLNRLAEQRRLFGVPDSVFKHPYVHLSRPERVELRKRKR